MVIGGNKNRCRQIGENLKGTAKFISTKMVCQWPFPLIRMVMGVLCFGIGLNSCTL